MILAKTMLVTVSVILSGVADLRMICSDRNTKAGVISLKQKNTSIPPDSDIKRMIEDACEGEGNLRVLENLKELPRTKLYRTLTRIRHSLAWDDALRVKIAFVFSELGVDYGLNSRILTSSLTRRPRYRGFSADESASLISGLLVTKKDPTLIKVLFASTEWADGALAEALYDTFAAQTEHDLKMFLASLRLEPLARRRKVYRLLNEGVSKSTEEREALRRSLSSITKSSRLYAIAQEMLKTIS